MLSRVADSLYWMSRYLARAEHTARVLDVQLETALDRDPEQARQRWWRALESLSIELPERELSDNYLIVQRVTFDPKLPSSLVSCVSFARENARQVRELISSEMWEMLNRLYLDVQRTRKDRNWIEEPHAFFQRVKTGVHLFQGLTDSTMTRGQGWHFITAGRAMERANAVCALLRGHLAPSLDQDQTPAEAYLEWVGTLRSCTAFEAYCKVDSAELLPANIAHFLVKNGNFPHSVRFSVETLCQSLDAIQRETGVVGRGHRLRHLVRRTRSTLEFRPIEEVLARGLGSFLFWVEENLNNVHEGLYDVYISNPLRLSQDVEIG